MEKIFLGLLIGFLLIFIWWIGLNYGIGMSMVHGANETCNMMRWTLLVCE